MEEDRLIEEKRNNVVIFVLAECQSDDTSERRKYDMATVEELCCGTLGVRLEAVDMVKMFRLGKR